LTRLAGIGKDFRVGERQPGRVTEVVAVQVDVSRVIEARRCDEQLLVADPDRVEVGEPQCLLLSDLVSAEQQPHPRLPAQLVHVAQEGTRVVERAAAGHDRA
jgi:hypothetical protein